MACFTYFIPNATKEAITQPDGRLVLSEPDLNTALGDYLTRQQQVIVFNGVGPDEQRGVHLYPRAHPDDMPRPLVYTPDKQEWRKTAGEYWIGWIKDSPPTPQELTRESSVGGHWGIVDKLDQQWLIPTITSTDDQRIHFPMDIVFSPDGSSKLQHRQENNDLVQLANDIFDHITQVTPQKTGWERTAALRLLSINHRVWVPEIVAFQEMGNHILTTESILVALGAACDWPTVQKEAMGRVERMADIAETMIA